MAYKCKSNKILIILIMNILTNLIEDNLTWNLSKILKR